MKSLEALYLNKNLNVKHIYSKDFNSNSKRICRSRLWLTLVDVDLFYDLRDIEVNISISISDNVIFVLGNYIHDYLKSILITNT